MTLLLRFLQQCPHILPQGAQADALHQVPGLLRHATGQVKATRFLVYLSQAVFDISK